MKTDLKKPGGAGLPAAVVLLSTLINLRLMPPGRRPEMNSIVRKLFQYFVLRKVSYATFIRLVRTIHLFARAACPPVFYRFFGPGAGGSNPAFAGRPWPATICIPEPEGEDQ